MGGLVSIVSYSRPSLMISRGLLRDYEPSDLLRMEIFEALVFILFIRPTLHTVVMLSPLLASLSLAAIYLFIFSVVKLLSDAANMSWIQL